MRGLEVLSEQELLHTMSATLNLCAGGPLMIAVLKELIGGREILWD